jgi:hypothetical protein
MEGFVFLTFQTLKFMPYFLVLNAMYDNAIPLSVVPDYHMTCWMT